MLVLERVRSSTRLTITAQARPEDSERSLSSGFQLHLAKPVDADYLVSAVATLAGR